MSNPLVKSLIELTGNLNVITVHKPMVDFTGSLEAAMLLEQLLFWTPRVSLPENWIAKSDKEFSDELSMTRYALRKARETLLDMGLVQIDKRRFNGSPTLHYRVNQSVLGEAWSDYLDSRNLNGETEQSEVRNKKNHSSDTKFPISETVNSITEITSETTSKPTQRTAAGATGEKLNPNYDYLIRELKRAEIGEPTRSELAAMPKLDKKTFDQVKKQWKQKGGGPGLLVRMLREAKPVLSDDELRQKYVNGPLAEFINH